MPLFIVELNRLADSMVDSAMTLWLHTAAPSNGDPDNGRTTVGGGDYETGQSLAPTDFSTASNGDVTNNAAIDFGEADEDVGTVTHWSLYRGSNPVAFGTLPNTAINSGDSFRINAQTLDINGSTT